MNDDLDSKLFPSSLPPRFRNTYFVTWSSRSILPLFQKNPSTPRQSQRAHVSCRLSPLSPENFNYSARFRIPSRIRRLKPANSVHETRNFPRPTPSPLNASSNSSCSNSMHRVESIEKEREKGWRGNEGKKLGKGVWEMRRWLHRPSSPSSSSPFLLPLSLSLSPLFSTLEKVNTHTYIQTHIRVVARMNSRVWTRARTPGGFT